MERTLFDWCGWDELDSGTLQFTGCTLKVPIGRFNIGELVPVIVISFEAGVLQLLEKSRRGSGALISEHKVRMVIND